MASVGHSQKTSNFSSSFGSWDSNHVLNSSGSGLLPAAVNFNLKNVISSCRNSHFPPITFKFSAGSRFRQFCSASSCDFRVLP